LPTISIVGQRSPENKGWMIEETRQVVETVWFIRNCKHCTAVSYAVVVDLLDRVFNAVDSVLRIAC